MQKEDPADSSEFRKVKAVASTQSAQDLFELGSRINLWKQFAEARWSYYPTSSVNPGWTSEGCRPDEGDV